MARHTLRLAPGAREVSCEEGQTLLEALRAAGVPVGSSCDADLICGYCRLRILEGAEHLSPVDAEEARLLRRKSAAPEERMACVARVLGPVTLSADYW